MPQNESPPEAAAPASGAAISDTAQVGVVAARRKLSSPWASHAWAPSAVLAASLPLAPWTLLTREEAVETYYAGASELRLYPGETGHYRDNLTSGRPSIWASLRLVAGEEYELGSVTADPYEGEAMAESMGNIVEALAMPAEVRAWIEAYVAAFHVERPFFKRKRHRHDPNALARRGPGDEA